MNNPFSRRPNHRTLAALAVALVTLGGIISCSQQRSAPPPASGAHPVIRIGVVPAAYYLPLFVIQEKGLLERRGYDVKLQVFTANTDLVDAFVNGDIDLAAQGSGTLFPFEAQHPGQYRFVYGQNNHSYSFIVPANSPVQSLKDLKGKIVVTWPSPTAKLAIQLSLKGQLAPGDVTIQPTDFKMISQVLTQGDAAAAFDTDVFTAQAIRTGQARYLVKYPLPDLVLNPFFNGGGIVSPKLIAAHPREAQDIEAACDEAIQYIQEHNQDARLTMSKYVPAAREDLLNAELDEFTPVSGVNVPKAQQEADLFLQNGLMKQKVAVAPLFYRADVVPGASATGGTK